MVYKYCVLLTWAADVLPCYKLISAEGSSLNIVPCQGEAIVSAITTKSLTPVTLRVSHAWQ